MRRHDALRVASQRLLYAHLIPETWIPKLHHDLSHVPISHRKQPVITPWGVLPATRKKTDQEAALRMSTSYHCMWNATLLSPSQKLPGAPESFPLQGAPPMP